MEEQEYALFLATFGGDRTLIHSHPHLTDWQAEGHTLLCAQMLSVLEENGDDVPDASCICLDDDASDDD